MATTAKDILKQVWGHDDFRVPQDKIIEAVLAGQDVLALLPTGGGKSICFQVPALMRAGVCLVISPLIALMKDQVENLKRKGIKAYAIYSGMTKREIDIVLDNCIYGDVKFLYVSPERLKADIFRERFAKMNVSLIAVDEAHCISQWGYDFRPPYLEIAEIRALQPTVNVIALTATATPQVQADIQEKLAFKTGHERFVKSFARSNLSYAVRIVEDKEEKLIEVLQQVQGTAVVYVRNRKATQDIAQLISKRGISATYYHAGLNNAQREVRQKDWMQGKVRVIVATNAFGMGIDKPDVRCVIHLDLPEHLEAYYQEAGRAGRDEKRAFAVILAYRTEGEELIERAEATYPPIDFIKKVYQSLANYYRIAVGSSLLADYDFDIHDFIATYKLDGLAVYRAIKLLQEAGFIELSEAYYKPSTLMFAVDNRKLYEFQIAQAKLDLFIKALLRLYGGELFRDFFKISEEKIAEVLSIPVSEVFKKLQYLEQSGIIYYQPRKDKPQLTFLTPRYDATSLPLDTRLIKFRKETAIEKARAMSAYVNDSTFCRTRRFMEYFGEESYNDCGACDVCIDKKKEQVENPIKDKVLNILQDQRLTFEELLACFKPADKENLASCLRNLRDVGILDVDAQKKLYIHH